MSRHRLSRETDAREALQSKKPNVMLALHLAYDHHYTPERIAEIWGEDIDYVRELLRQGVVHWGMRG